MRIVIKVGTSTLTHATGKLNIRRVELLCKVMSDLKTRDTNWYWCPPALSPWALGR